MLRLLNLYQHDKLGWAYSVKISQKCSYSKWWSALKLPCLCIISYNCQNSGLLEVLTKVLQTFDLCYYSLCLTISETDSVTKTSELCISCQPLQYTPLTSETFHGLYVPSTHQTHHSCAKPHHGIVNCWSVVFRLHCTRAVHLHG